MEVERTKQEYDEAIRKSTRAYRRGKQLVTRAKNADDWQRVKEIAQETLDAFADIGMWPDDWAHFERAKMDAEFALRRSECDW